MADIQSYWTRAAKADRPRRKAVKAKGARAVARAALAKARPTDGEMRAYTRCAEVPHVADVGARGGGPAQDAAAEALEVGWLVGRYLRGQRKRKGEAAARLEKLLKFEKRENTAYERKAGRVGRSERIAELMQAMGDKRDLAAQSTPQGVHAVLMAAVVEAKCMMARARQPPRHNAHSHTRSDARIDGDGDQHLSPPDIEPFANLPPVPESVSATDDLSTPRSSASEGRGFEGARGAGGTGGAGVEDDGIAGGADSTLDVPHRDAASASTPPAGAPSHGAAAGARTDDIVLDLADDGDDLDDEDVQDRVDAVGAAAAADESGLDTAAIELDVDLETDVDVDVGAAGETSAPNGAPSPSRDGPPHSRTHSPSQAQPQQNQADGNARGSGPDGYVEEAAITSAHKPTRRVRIAEGHDEDDRAACARPHREGTGSTTGRPGGARGAAVSSTSSSAAAAASTTAPPPRPEIYVPAHAPTGALSGGVRAPVGPHGAIGTRVDVPAVPRVTSPASQSHVHYTTTRDGRVVVEAVADQLDPQAAIPGCLATFELHGGGAATRAAHALGHPSHAYTSPNCGRKDSLRLLRVGYSPPSRPVSPAVAPAAREPRTTHGHLAQRRGTTGRGVTDSLSPQADTGGGGDDTAAAGTGPEVDTHTVPPDDADAGIASTLNPRVRWRLKPTRAAATRGQHPRHGAGGMAAVDRSDSEGPASPEVPHRACGGRVPAGGSVRCDSGAPGLRGLLLELPRPRVGGSAGEIADIGHRRNREEVVQKHRGPGVKPTSGSGGGRSLHNGSATKRRKRKRRDFSANAGASDGASPGRAAMQPTPATLQRVFDVAAATLQRYEAHRERERAATTPSDPSGAAGAVLRTAFERGLAAALRGQAEAFQTAAAEEAALRRELQQQVRTTLSSTASPPHVSSIVTDGEAVAASASAADTLNTTSAAGVGTTPNAEDALSLLLRPTVSLLDEKVDAGALEEDPPRATSAAASPRARNACLAHGSAIAVAAPAAAAARVASQNLLTPGTCGDAGDVDPTKVATPLCLASPTAEEVDGARGGLISPVGAPWVSSPPASPRAAARAGMPRGRGLTSHPRPPQGDADVLRALGVDGACHVPGGGGGVDESGAWTLGSLTLTETATSVDGGGSGASPPHRPLPHAHPMLMGAPGGGAAEGGSPARMWGLSLEQGYGSTRGLLSATSRSTSRRGPSAVTGASASGSTSFVNGGLGGSRADRSFRSAKSASHTPPAPFSVTMPRADRVGVYAMSSFVESPSQRRQRRRNDWQQQAGGVGGGGASGEVDPDLLSASTSPTVRSGSTLGTFDSEAYAKRFSSPRHLMTQLRANTVQTILQRHLKRMRLRVKQWTLVAWKRLAMAERFCYTRTLRRAFTALIENSNTVHRDNYRVIALAQDLHTRRVYRDCFVVWARLARVAHCERRGHPPPEFSTPSAAWDRYHELEGEVQAHEELASAVAGLYERRAIWRMWRADAAEHAAEMRQLQVAYRFCLRRTVGPLYTVWVNKLKVSRARQEAQRRLLHGCLIRGFRAFNHQAKKDRALIAAMHHTRRARVWRRWAKRVQKAQRLWVDPHIHRDVDRRIGTYGRARLRAYIFALLHDDVMLTVWRCLRRLQLHTRYRQLAKALAERLVGWDRGRPRGSPAEGGIAASMSPDGAAVTVSSAVKKMPEPVPASTPTTGGGGDAKPTDDATSILDKAGIAGSHATWARETELKRLQGSPRSVAPDDVIAMLARLHPPVTHDERSAGGVGYGGWGEDDAGGRGRRRSRSPSTLGWSETRASVGGVLCFSPPTVASGGRSPSVWGGGESPAGVAPVWDVASGGTLWQHAAVMPPPALDPDAIRRRLHAGPGGHEPLADTRARFQGFIARMHTAALSYDALRAGRRVNLACHTFTVPKYDTTSRLINNKAAPLSPARRLLLQDHMSPPPVLPLALGAGGTGTAVDGGGYLVENYDARAEGDAVLRQDVPPPVLAAADIEIPRDQLQALLTEADAASAERKVAEGAGDSDNATDADAGDAAPLGPAEPLVEDEPDDVVVRPSLPTGADADADTDAFNVDVFTPKRTQSRMLREAQAQVQAAPEAPAVTAGDAAADDDDDDALGLPRRRSTKRHGLSSQRGSAAGMGDAAPIRRESSRASPLLTRRQSSACSLASGSRRGSLAEAARPAAHDANADDDYEAVDPARTTTIYRESSFGVMHEDSMDCGEGGGGVGCDDIAIDIDIDTTAPADGDAAPDVLLTATADGGDGSAAGVASEDAASAAAAADALPARGVSFIAGDEEPCEGGTRCSNGTAVGAPAGSIGDRLSRSSSFVEKFRGLRRFSRHHAGGGGGTPGARGSPQRRQLVLSEGNSLNYVRNAGGAGGGMVGGFGTGAAAPAHHTMFRGKQQLGTRPGTPGAAVTDGFIEPRAAGRLQVDDRKPLRLPERGTLAPMLQQWGAGGGR